MRERHGIYRFRTAVGMTHYGLYDQGRLVDVWGGGQAAPQARASVKKMDHDSIVSAKREIERRRQLAWVEAVTSR